LLNLVETLTVELRKAQAENRYLRKHSMFAKSGGGKTRSVQRALHTGFAVSERSEPTLAANHTEHQAQQTGSNFGRPEEVLKLDRATLPPDAEFKGFEDVVVQELHIRTDNVRFRKEKYYALPRARPTCPVATGLRRGIRAEPEESVVCCLPICAT